jgi:hypothetical protein
VPGRRRCGCGQRPRAAARRSRVSRFTRMKCPSGSFAVTPREWRGQL